MPGSIILALINFLISFFDLFVPDGDSLFDEILTAIELFVVLLLKIFEFIDTLNGILPDVPYPILHQLDEWNYLEGSSPFLS